MCKTKLNFIMSEMFDWDKDLNKFRILWTITTDDLQHYHNCFLDKLSTIGHLLTISNTNIKTRFVGEMTFSRCSKQLNISRHHRQLFIDNGIGNCDVISSVIIMGAERSVLLQWFCNRNALLSIIRHDDRPLHIHYNGN